MTVYDGYKTKCNTQSSSVDQWAAAGIYSIPGILSSPIRGVNMTSFVIGFCVHFGHQTLGKL